MSHDKIERRPISSVEMTHYLNEARRERAEMMAQLTSRAGSWIRGLFSGTASGETARQGVPAGQMAARGR